MKKNLKVVFASLMLAIALVGFSSFKADSFNKKAFSTICFTIEDPESSSSATAWEEGNAASLCQGVDVVCGICFDNQFLDENDKPNSRILGASSSFDGVTAGQTYTIPAEGTEPEIVVTVYKRNND